MPAPTNANTRTSSARDLARDRARPVMATSARTAANLRVADRIPARGEGRRLALVLWHGAVGGAESFTVALAQRMRSLGTGAEVIFIANPDRLAERLRAAGVPYRTLGFSRGRDAACHPRRFANDVALVGADGALL